jgi:TonB-dependent starch-binding outer membrane protein SusC
LAYFQMFISQVNHKRMKKILSLLTLCLILALLSCTATQNGSIEKGGANDMSDNTNIPLDQYLRRVPGLRVSGSGTSAGVQLIGIGNRNSLMTTNAPLFILDDVNVGTNLGQVASLVQTVNIKTVRVLKSADETSIYGVQGASGVIEIITKKK